MPSQTPASRLLPYGLAAGAFVLYAVISIARHERFETGFDLGVFEQAVRAYASLQPPIATLKGPGVDLLGDHFHPIVATLAPPYRLFPSPLTLLVAQAALMAAAVVPVARLAIARLGAAAGACLGVGCALSWGMLNAVAFDFHEIAFAVPLTAFSMEALALRRWRAAALWALPLILVKEDLALTVAAVGACLVLQGRRRLGAGLAAAGAAAFAVIVLVAIPLFGHHGYTYWDNLAVRGHPPATAEVGAHVLEAAAGLPLSPARLRTLVLLLAPTAFVALRSPLLVVAVPTVAWRMLSGNPYFWGTDFHYDAVLVPIVFVAFADGVATLRAEGGLRARLAALAVPVSAAVTVILCAGLPLPQLAEGTGPHAAPLRELVTPVDPGSERRAAAERRMLSLVPDGAAVAATDSLIPHLTGRATVYLYPMFPARRVQPEWIVTTTDRLRGPARLEQAGYRMVAEDDGVVVMRRGS